MDINEHVETSEVSRLREILRKDGITGFEAIDIINLLILMKQSSQVFENEIREEVANLSEVIIYDFDELCKQVLTETSFEQLLNTLLTF